MGTTITDSHRIERPATWKEAYLGAAPFLAWGAATVLEERFHLFWIASLVACPVFFFFAFVWGWIKGFPRWWFVLPGLLVIISAWMTGMPADNLLFFHNAQGLLGLWAWAPLAIVTVVLLFINPESLGQLLRIIWQDWTLLSFTLYGVLAWLTWAFFDENMSPLVPAGLAITELLLAVGALAYMRAGRSSTRFLSLLVGMALAWLPVTYVNAIYWNGLQAPWMGFPKEWAGAVTNMLRSLGILALILLLPALFGLARMAGRYWPKK